MMTTPTTPIVFHADAEHTSLRITVVLILGLAIIISFLLINAVWSALVPTLPDFSFIITCTSAIVLSLVAVWAIEKGLQRVWHSGRSITLAEQGISVQDEGVQYELSWEGHLNLLSWQFVLDGYKRGGRERRVPKGWHCLAFQVQEGENRIVVFAFMSAKDAAAFTEGDGRNEFHQIYPAQVFTKAMNSTYFSVPSRPEKIPNEYLTGKDGSYWLGEQYRWWEGFELTVSEFEQFINIVTAKAEKSLP